MIQTRHTPGPWSSFNEYGNRGGCFGADQKTLVAHLPHALPGDRHRTPPPGEAEANFYLIDAAPALLSNGAFLLDRLDEFEITDEQAKEWMGHIQPAIERLRAAIAEAGNQSPVSCCPGRWSDETA